MWWHKLDNTFVDFRELGQLFTFLKKISLTINYTVNIFYRTDKEVSEKNKRSFWCFSTSNWPFSLKKKSATLENQIVINYLKKIVELLIAIGSILTCKLCEMWSCECTIYCSLLEFIYRCLTDMRNWLQLSKALIQIQHSSDIRK